MGLKGGRTRTSPRGEGDWRHVAKIADGFRDRATVMHQVELGAARVSTNFGLGVAFGAKGTYGGDGLRPLRTPQMAAKLRRD